ncbi:hypothetical protein FKV24_012645 [Lysobacter maris]|uniref:Uncharacterized protein n=2 Tax=Marilutibacter maris TaxID=1605891 RepID=A0A508AHM9_9GAMM|nr:hypothetical protein FKV24_012645 [Lysobacter maris]
MNISDDIKSDETVQAKVARILAGSEQLTSKEATELRREAGARRLEVQTRLDQIDHRDRVKALQTGSPDQVRTLTEERKSLDIERDQLTAQIDELTRRREAALTREAVEGMPAMQSTLAEQVARAERLGGQFAEALREINGTVQAIMTAKARAEHAYIPVPGASVEMIGRIRTITSWSAPNLLTNGRHFEHWAEGIQPTQAPGKHLEDAA